MLSIQDVLDYCDLDSGEIEAIAEEAVNAKPEQWAEAA